MFTDIVAHWCKMSGWSLDRPVAVWQAELDRRVIEARGDARRVLADLQRDAIDPSQPDEDGTIAFLTGLTVWYWVEIQQFVVKENLFLALLHGFDHSLADAREVCAFSMCCLAFQHPEHARRIGVPDAAIRRLKSSPAPGERQALQEALRCSIHDLSGDESLRDWPEAFELFLAEGLGVVEGMARSDAWSALSEYSSIPQVRQRIRRSGVLELATSIARDPATSDYDRGRAVRLMRSYRIPLKPKGR